jgi:hypothetical protein
MRQIWGAIVLGFLVIAAAGCYSAEQQPALEGEASMKIQLTSTAFKDGETIPQKYTCDGENLSPPLAWSGMPPGVKSLALIADDPDAPMGTWVHWVIYDIQPTIIGLSEGVSTNATVEGVGVQGVNGSRRSGYSGPCPPRGKPHRYYFKLYALDKVLNLAPGINKAELEKALRGHILAEGQLMGSYGR